MMNYARFSTVVISLLLLSACSGSAVQPQLSICEELDDNDEWVEPVVQAEQTYGAPVSLTLALLELPLSDLDKKHIRPRASDWDEYRIRSERWDASPNDPADAVDFIGWFSRQSVERNQIPWSDAGQHYLALRLGHGGYHRLQPEKFPELVAQSQDIQRRAQRWQQELMGCKSQWQGESWFSTLKFW